MPNSSLLSYLPDTEKAFFSQGKRSGQRVGTDILSPLRLPVSSVLKIKHQIKRRVRGETQRH
jgi:hypothetical protein